MVFSSVVFLGLFLPSLLILYFLIPNRRWRNYILLIFSLLFYAWGEPVWILTMILTAFVDFTNAKIIRSIEKNGGSKNRKYPLIASIIINIGILIIFKYSGFFSDIIYNLVGFRIPAWQNPMPIGISFYTFQSLSYIIDVYRKDTEVQDNFLYYLMYVSMFPQLVAGPIVRYRDVAFEIENRKENIKDFSDGALRFTAGFGKKILLANNAGAIANKILLEGSTHIIPMGDAWIGTLFYMFQIYFDFSGYSDMAIGLGKIFGFNYKENFNYPYMAKSITDFWRRWHISLSGFFKDYVYIPLGGNRKHQNLNIFIVWALTGLWHGASFNFIFWGLYYGVLLIIEKNILKDFLEKHYFISRIYTMIVVLFGWLIFYSAEPGLLSNLTSSFFNISSGVFKLSLIAKTLLIKNIFLLIVLAIGSTIIPKKIAENLKNSKGGAIYMALFIIFMFLISFSVMIGQTYNPFLYFRF